MEWFLALLALFVCSAVVIALLTHLFFVYEYGNGDYHERYGDPMNLGPVLARGIASSVAAQCAVYGTFPLALLQPLLFPDKSGRSQRSSTLPPVILVHGLYHNAAAWLYASRILRRAGFPVYVYTYNSWTQNYHQAREGLTRKVEKIRALTGRKRVFLMGHSLGGLIIRGYLSRARSHGKVRAAVTLGSPHQGSKLAVLGLGTMARSLKYRGKLIRELEATDHPPDCPCLALYSEVDNFVLPREGLFIHLENWTLEPISPPVSHVAILFDSKVIHGAVKFFKQSL